MDSIEEVENTITKLEYKREYYNMKYLKIVKKQDKNFSILLSTIVYNISLLNDFIIKLKDKLHILNMYINKLLKNYYK